MNAVAKTYVEVTLAVVLVSILFALTFRKELVAGVRKAVAWLLKVSFFDFVQMLIFIKPWKQHSRPIGVVVWLVLAYITGRYMIGSQPKLSEISGPYIPMIGYVYYLSLLFIVGFALYAVGKVARRD